MTKINKEIVLNLIKIFDKENNRSYYQAVSNKSYDAMLVCGDLENFSWEYISHVYLTNQVLNDILQDCNNNFNNITFSDLNLGDMFNTKIARFVKVSNNEAIVVMSGVLTTGEITKFPDDYIINEILFSNKYSF